MFLGREHVCHINREIQQKNAKSRQIWSKFRYFIENPSQNYESKETQKQFKSFNPNLNRFLQFWSESNFVQKRGKCSRNITKSGWEFSCKRRDKNVVYVGKRTEIEYLRIYEKRIERQRERDCCREGNWETLLRERERGEEGGRT